MHCEAGNPGVTITAEAGDTLGGILIDNVPGVNKTNVDDVMSALDNQPGFRGKGPIEDFHVLRTTGDRQLHEVSEGSVYDIPAICTPSRNP